MPSTFVIIIQNVAIKAPSRKEDFFSLLILSLSKIYLIPD